MSRRRRRRPIGAAQGEIGKTFHQRFLLNVGSSIADARIAGPVLSYAGNGGAGGIFNRNGLLVQPINNEPRFTHDPANSNASLGILIEKATTNLLTHSRQFEVTSGTWTNPTRATITADDTVALSGSTTADKIVLDGTAATNHRAEATLALTDSTIYAFSVFHKADELDFVHLEARLHNGQSPGRFFDLANGTLESTEGSGSLVDSAILNINNGYHLCWISMDMLTGASQFAGRMFLAEADLDITMDGDSASGIFASDAQLETSSFPTSPVLTTTASVGRTAETLSADVSSQLGLVNTLVVSARAGYDAGVVCQIDDGTESERYRVERNSSNEIHVIVTDGGATQADLNLGVVADQTDFKVAVRFDTNNFAASLDGAAVVEDGSGSLPTVDTIRYGSDTSGDEWNSTIAEGKLFNLGKSNSSLREIAQL